MNGKETYLDYIRGKFSAIKSSNSIVSAKVYYQERIGKHIVVLDQNGNTAALELTIKDGKVQRMWMRPVSLTP